MRATGPTVLGAVAVGGALGAVARHGVSVLAGDGWSGDVVATLTVNLVGSLLVGLVVAHVLDRRSGASLLVLRCLLVTGFLGGFTTYSALAVEVRDGAGESPAATALYVLASVVLGPLLARAGLALGGRRPHPPRAAVEEQV